jgi:hypothetical protein
MTGPDPAAVVQAFRAAVSAGSPDWQWWAVRLADVLQRVYVTGRAPGATWTAPDGSAWLSPGDLQTVLAGLQHACHCPAATSLATRAAAVRIRLGDDR